MFDFLGTGSGVAAGAADGGFGAIGLAGEGAANMLVNSPGPDEGAGEAGLEKVPVFGPPCGRGVVAGMLSADTGSVANIRVNSPPLAKDSRPDAGRGAGGSGGILPAVGAPGYASAFMMRVNSLGGWVDLEDGAGLLNGLERRGVSARGDCIILVNSPEVPGCAAGAAGA